MSKGRSPNYPQLTLEDALTKIRKVYDAEHTHVADKEVVAKVLGYTSLNGASVATIGTLRRYGLLIDENEGLKVSDDTVTVLELEKGNPDRDSALKRIAFTPILFEEIQQTFGDTLPSDVNLRHYLIKKKFLPKAADEAIRIFRANLEFVTKEIGVYNEIMKVDAVATPEVIPPNPKSSPQYQYKPIPEIPIYNVDEPVEAGQELKFRLSADSDVKLIFRGEVTQEAIEKLVGLLNLSKDTFPRKTLLSEKKSEEPAPTVQQLESSFPSS